MSPSKVIYYNKLGKNGEGQIMNNTVLTVE